MAIKCTAPLRNGDFGEWTDTWLVSAGRVLDTTVELNLQYVRKRSPQKDIKILFRSVKFVGRAIRAF